MVFLRLVHVEYQIDHKTQPFWVKVVYLAPNIQTLAGYDINWHHPFGTKNLPSILKQY